METKIRVSGRHINELSENIPSNIFALNELIKNAYDACATLCEITIDKKNCQVVVKDNGKGLSENSISELFHLSRSSKRFGKLISCGKKKRRVQGSKGLGFLAAFKFGEVVTWDTVHEGVKRIFSVDKKIIANLNDIGSHQITVDSQPFSGRGTSITICSEEHVVDELIEYFENDSNFLKLIGSFIDDGFEVSLNVPGRQKRTRVIPNIKDINLDDQLFYITYSSSENKIKIFKGGYLEDTIDFSLSLDSYSINIELMIYSLESHGKKKIIPYFYKPVNDSITPLVFINDNLFNNYNIFDTDIFRSRRSRSALPQMIGYVKVYSDSPYFEFNSDRTNFVDNYVTKSLIRDLRKINEVIQSKGADIKEKYKLGKGRLTGPAYPKRPEGGSVKALVRAYVSLTKEVENVYIPSKQLTLLDYVVEARDSEGASISKGKINVYVDSEALESKVLRSINESQKMVVDYSFSDPNTGNVTSRLIINFKEKRASITGGKDTLELFYIPGSSKDYEIGIDHVSVLMRQISELGKRADRYNYVIACSLRTIFELSTQAVRSNREKVLSHKFKSRAEVKGVARDVVKVIKFINDNDKVATKIAIKLGLNYQSLKPFLEMDDFEKHSTNSNIGAHTGAQQLTISSIRDIAKISGYYAAFCDILIRYVDEELIKSSKIIDL